MKEKIDFYSSLLFSLLFCVVLYDAILLMGGYIRQVPGSHRQMLMVGFLLWFASLIVRRDRDDDWAGQGN